MAKSKSDQKPTKSEFLRKHLSKNPELDLKQLNRRWAKAGQPGEISSALFYQVRSKLGIKTVWQWVKNPDVIYQFKITLLDARPKIWRRIQTADCTLDTLHEHIQTAMGWTNSHLHHFKIDGAWYGDPMLMEEDFASLKYNNSTTTLLSQLLPADNTPVRWSYEYDFGDSWQHELVYEGRHPVEAGRRYPLCLEGEGACPPEDVGGVWGYADFLQAIADPHDPQHDDMLEWIGGKRFDPSAFHPGAATTRMRHGLPDWRQVLR